MKRIKTTRTDSIVSFLNIQLAPLGGTPPYGMKHDIKLTDLEFNHPEVQEMLRRGYIEITTDEIVAPTVKIADPVETPKIKVVPPVASDLPPDNADVNVAHDFTYDDVVAPRKKGK